MKKTILFLLSIVFLITALSSTSANAQPSRMIGLKAGINIASLHNSSADLDNLTSYSAGVFVDFDLPLLPLGLRPEVNFSQKGGEETYLVDGETFTNTIVSSHIEIPVLLKWSPPVPGPVKPHLLAGPYLGFLMDSDIRIKNPRGTTIISEGLEDQSNSTEFGAAGAVGTDFILGRTHFVVEARYSLAMTDAFSKDVLNDFLRGSQNRVLTISLGIKI